LKSISYIRFIKNSSNRRRDIPYTARYFLKQKKGSEKSARKILPIVIKLIKPKSIIDVGCRVGCWLLVAIEYGIKDILGIDGEWIDKNMLQIPDQYFRVHDLRKPLTLNRHFDLCICLEVAEHIPSKYAEKFIDSLTGLSPVILFSAAIPFQGGEGHKNEQWPDYWASLFEKKGYVAVDYIRNIIWMDEDVEWWYAQNVLLFINSRFLCKILPNLDKIKMYGNFRDLVKIHPKYWPNDPGHLIKKILKLIIKYPHYIKKIVKNIIIYFAMMMKYGKPSATRYR
jgi:SAM-dependent methyltransferase